jgi:ketosteroid isomerase-like protein
MIVMQELQSARDVVDRYYTATFAKDHELRYALVDDDVEVHEPDLLPYGGIYRGRSELRALLEALVPLMDGDRFEAEAFAVADDRVIAVVNAWVPLAGKPLVISEEVLVCDQLIVRFRVFLYDPTPMIEAATRAGVTRASILEMVN